MKVVEIRNELKKYNMEEKDKIIIELYKRIPKRVKEEYDIDGYLKNIKVNENTKKEKEVKLTFEELASEINYFLECAWNELYSEPNRIISKSERSKWRFKAKKYYKELSSIDINSEYYDESNKLLIELFKVLSRGTNYLLFSNWETFRAVQISQEDFFDLIMKRVLVNFNEENLETIVKLLEVDKDPYGSLYKVIYNVFLNNLTSNNQLEMALEIIKKEVDDLNIQVIELSKKGKEYDLKEKYNYFVLTILDIYIRLEDVNKGIEYYNKYYKAYNYETKIYDLLEELEDNEAYQEWISVYENHKEIQNRESMQVKYKLFKRQLGVK